MVIGLAWGVFALTSVVVGRRGGVCANRRAGRPTSGLIYWKFGVDVLLVAPLGSSWPPEIPKSPRQDTHHLSSQRCVGVSSGLPRDVLGASSSGPPLRRGLLLGASSSGRQQMCPPTWRPKLTRRRSGKSTFWASVCSGLPRDLPGTSLETPRGLRGTSCRSCCRFRVRRRISSNESDCFNTVPKLL